MVSGTAVTEYVNGTITSLFPSARRSLNLPVEETPEYHENDLTKWAELASPAHYGDNSTWASTIHSGKPVIYLKTGTYLANNRTYPVPLTVRKFTGLGAVINGGDQFAVKLVVREGDENSPPLFIEHLCRRPVVIKHAHVRYTGSPNAGKLYLQDVALKNLLTLHPGQRVWARQLNSEPDNGRIVNNGGNLWVLGLKTENRGLVIKTTSCGKTELLGGLIYPVKTFTTSQTAFICEEAQQSLIFGATSYASGKMYAVLVRERQNGVVKELRYGGQVRLFLPLHAGPGGTCSNPSRMGTGTPAPEAGASLQLSPNPARDWVDLEWGNFAEGPLTIAVTDALGAVVYQAVVEGNTRHRVPAGGLKSGVYFVALTSGQASVTRKLVVKR